MELRIRYWDCVIGPVTRPLLPKVVSRALPLSKQRSSSASSRGRKAPRLALADGVRRALRADKNHMGNLLRMAVRDIMKRAVGARTVRWGLSGPVSTLLGS